MPGFRTMHAAVNVKRLDPTHHNRMPNVLALMNPRFLRPSAAALSALLCAVSASAASVLIEFDELPASPANGLTFKGVTFGFEVSGAASDDATFNVDLGFGSTLQTTDPVMEGDATGLLTLTFAVPTPTLSFGLLLGGATDYTPGAVIDLYSGAVLVDSIGLDTLADPVEAISEAHFLWSNAGMPIDRAVVDFDDNAGRFAMDNLSFVPEPLPTLAAFGLVGFAAARFLRRRLA